jgi:hypothetical protein
MVSIIVAGGLCVCLGILRSFDAPTSPRLCKGCPWGRSNRNVRNRRNQIQVGEGE